MRFMIIVKATKDSEAEVMPIGPAWEPLFAEMAKYHEELQGPASCSMPRDCSRAQRAGASSTPEANAR